MFKSTRNAIDRGNNINAVRFFAATLVVFGHSYMFVTGTPDSQPTFCGVQIAAFAVDVFFILSGCLISLSWKKDSNCARFFLRRAFRIFPGLIVVVLLSALVLGPAVSELDPVSYFKDRNTWLYLLNALFPDVTHFRTLPGVFLNNNVPKAVNTSLWTLKYEMLCYCFVPLVYMAVKKTNAPKKTFVIIPAVFLALNLAIEGTPWIEWHSAIVNFSRLFYFFFIGVMVEEYSLVKRFNGQHATVALALLLVLQPDYGCFSLIVAAVLIPIATIGFSYPANPIFGKTFSVNDYSYGIYIYAFPIQQTVTQILPTSILSAPLLFCVSIPLTCLCAFLSWHFVEKRALAYGKSVTKKLKEPSFETN